MQRIALVVGVSGIGGSSIARELLAQAWRVHGLARRPGNDIPGVLPVAADLLNPATAGDTVA